MKKLKKIPTIIETITFETMYWQPRNSVINQTPAVFSTRLRPEVMRYRIACPVNPPSFLRNAQFLPKKKLTIAPQKAPMAVDVT